MSKIFDPQKKVSQKISQFIGLKDVADLNSLVNTALDFKKNPLAFAKYGEHKTLVLLFFNPSLRTRLSTQKAGFNLGMSVISMNANQGWNLEFEEQVIMNSDKAEHVREAAQVVSQYADIIGIRSFPSLTHREKDYQDQVINLFAKYANVPVISLESAIRHPLQSLTDLMTIEEYKKTARPKVVLSWAPHPKALPQAVANSFLEWMHRADINLSITHPPGYGLAPEFVKDIEVEYDQEKALENADFVYVKNWSSYHQYGQKTAPAKNWMMTLDKMKKTEQAYFMHCLPVRRNVVVEDKVLDSDISLAIEQANNRTYAAQSVLYHLLNTIKNEQ